MIETKFKILIVVVFYLIEIGILYVLYKAVYKKKMVSNRSLFDFSKIFISYFVFMIYYKIGRYKKNDELDDFLQKNDELRMSMYIDIVGSIALFGILPFIIVTFMHNEIMHKIAVLFIVAGVIYFMYEIKERMPVLLARINQSQIFLYKFEKLKKYVVRKTKGNDTRIKDFSIFLRTYWQNIKSLGIVRGSVWFFLLICSIVISVMTIREIIVKGIGNFLREQMNMKTVFFFSPRMLIFEVPFIIALLLFDLLERRAKKREYEREEECTVSNTITNDNMNSLEGVITDQELEPWRNEIIRMCNYVGIRGIICVADDIGEKKIISIMQRNEIPAIIVNQDLLHDLEKCYDQSFFEAVKLMIAHEIAHICYHDPLPKHKEIRALKIYVFNIACFIGTGAVIFFIHNTVLNVIMSFVAMALLLENMIMIDEKYWMQVMEFRADRIGMEISGTSVETFKLTLQITDSKERGVKISTNLIQRIYDKYAEVHIHPRKERRLYEVIRKKGWHVTDYIRYFFLIGRNVIFRRGWEI